MRNQSMKTTHHPSSLSNDVELLSEEVGPPARSRYAFARDIVANVFFPFLTIRLLLMLVGLTTIYYIAPLINRQQPIVLDSHHTHFPEMLYLMWNRFDSGFYLTIAHDGYWDAHSLHAQSNWGFFPFYPLV